MRPNPTPAGSAGGTMAALADWVEAFRPADIPDGVRADARRLLMDAVGCAASGSRDALIGRLRSTLALVGGRGEATSIGGPSGIALRDAVLLDGAKTRVQDFNDAYVHDGLVGHPSDTVAALVQVAALSGVRGARLVEAIVLCYELYCRLIDGFRVDGQADHTAASALAVPATIAWMLGFERAQLIGAVSLSTSLARSSAEIRRGQLSSAKSIANAVIAADATMLAIAARSGLTGPAQALDGPAGWLPTMFPDVDPARLLAPIGADYRISRVSLKAFPCIGTAQGAVAAAQSAHPDFVRRDADVTGIRLSLPHSELVAGQIADEDRWHPTTRETADHSIPYLVAVALLDGSIHEGQYAARRWEDPRVRAVIDRLTVGVGDDPTVSAPLGARIAFEGRAGTGWEVSVDAPPGHPRNPLSRDQQLARFFAQTTKVWSAAHAGRIVAAIDALDDLPSAAELTALFAAEPPRTTSNSATPRSSERRQ